MILALLASFYQLWLEEFGSSSSRATTTAASEWSTKSLPIKTVNRSDKIPSNEIEMKKSSKNLLNQLLMAFSLVNNTRMLFQHKPNKFGSVDFFRFLMLINVIVMHQYYVPIGWSTWPFHKRLFQGILAKAGTETRYIFLRNSHNTDFFFALR